MLVVRVDQEQQAAQLELLVTMVQTVAAAAALTALVLKMPSRAAMEEPAMNTPQVLELPVGVVAVHLQPLAHSMAAMVGKLEITAAAAAAVAIQVLQLP